MKRTLFIITLLASISLNLFAEDFNAVINDDNVRFRSNPTLDKSEVLGKLNKGDKLKIRTRTKEKVTIDGSEDYWFEFSLDRGNSSFPWLAEETAWVYGKYLDLTDGRSKDDFWDEYAEDLVKKDLAERVLRSLDEETLNFCRSSKNAIKSERYGWNEDRTIIFSGIFNYYRYKDYCLTVYKPEDDDNDEYLRFVGVKCLKDIPNPMGIKLGMTRDEVIKILGDDFHTTKKNRFYYYGFGGSEYDVFISLHFEFDGDELISINVYEDGHIALYGSVLESDCEIIFDRF